MTYIKTGIDRPGIGELLRYKESTGAALMNLAQTLMHGPSGLTPGERELIASYVSKLNNCDFCHSSHAAVASSHLNDGGKTISCVIENIDTAPISEKMKSLLKIAAQVQQSGKAVAEVHIELAKNNDATDEDIHDTVLIAAAFCMFNRYVDGLGTSKASPEEYTMMGEMLATKGYN